jgi:hypothetical protein
VKAHLVFLAPARDAEMPFDDEGGEGFAIDLGKDHEHVRKAAVRDP